MSKLTNYFWPIKKDEERSRFELRNGKLFIFLSICAFGTLIFMAFINVIAGKPLIGLINLPSAFLIMSALILYKKTGHYEIAALLVFFSVSLTISIQHYLAHILQPVDLLWYPLIVICSFYFVRVKYACIFLSINILLALLAHFLPRPYVPLDETFVFTINMVLIIVTQVMAAIFGSRVSKEDEQLFHELERRNKTLFELNETSTVLLGVLSHDLANQVAIAQLASNVLYSENVGNSNEQKHYLSMLNKSITHMGDMVRHVRTITAGQAGKMKIELRPVEIIKVFDISLNSFSEALKKKSIEITLDFPIQKEHPLLICAESVSLCHSVFNNLLSNAVKFSNDRSKIEVSIKEENHNVIFRIKDSGIGIPESIIDQLFNPNISTSRKGTNNEDGTGFGMPIMKMYLDRYGATVEIHSSVKTENSGTEFVITFKKDCCTTTTVASK